jgi:ATP adenylyltransferase
MNLGAVAGAGFAEHLHLHVMPRSHGDTSSAIASATTSIRGPCAA